MAQFQVAGSSTRTTAGDSSDGVSYNLILDRDGTHWRSHTHYLYTSPGFWTELGFLGRMQRPDSQELHQWTAYRFRPAASPLTSWGPSLFVGRVLDTGGNDLDFVVNSEMEWNWVGDTAVEIGYSYRDERLPADEFDSLTYSADFSQNTWFLAFRTERFTRFGFEVGLDGGTSINFVPPEGDEPELADYMAARASLLWRPVSPLRLDLSWLRTEFDNRGGPGRIFTNTIYRVRANWQFTKELSLRVIADLEDTDPVPGETSLTDEEYVRLDALVKYLWNPWKALYVGYTSEREDVRTFNGSRGTFVDLRDEGSQFFVKFSYLFQL